MTRSERIAVLDARFVRVRSRTGPMRHRRPGEVSFPWPVLGFVPRGQRWAVDAPPREPPFDDPPPGAVPVRR
jgi:hypothetical protein